MTSHFSTDLRATTKKTQEPVDAKSDQKREVEERSPLLTKTWEKIEQGLFAASSSDEGLSSSDDERAQPGRSKSAHRAASSPSENRQGGGGATEAEKPQVCKPKKKRSCTTMQEAEVVVATNEKHAGAEEQQDVAYRAVTHNNNSKQKRRRTNRPSKSAQTMTRAAMQQSLQTLVSEFCQNVIADNIGEQMGADAKLDDRTTQAMIIWQYLKFPTAKILALDQHPLYQCPARCDTTKKVWTWVVRSNNGDTERTLAVFSAVYRMLCSPGLAVNGYTTHVGLVEKKEAAAAPVQFFASTASK